jgi:hypothetical protein
VKVEKGLRPRPLEPSHDDGDRVIDVLTLISLPVTRCRLTREGRSAEINLSVARNSVPLSLMAVTGGRVSGAGGSLSGVVVSFVYLVAASGATRWRFGSSSSADVGI